MFESDNLRVQMTLDFTLNNKQTWFSILAFEFHFVHDT